MTAFDEAAKAARREYYRQYRRNNPQKIKEANARYWQRMAEKMAAEQKEAGKNAETERV